MVNEALTRFDQTLKNLKREVLALRERPWLSAGIVLVIVLVGGLVALIVLGRKLPEHFWDGFGGAVLGAIVGGAMAAGGGFLATLRIRRLDIERAEDQATRDYRAAVRVVLDELYANQSVANNLMVREHFVTEPSSIGLSEASYLEMQRSLADRLSEQTHNIVANAYAQIRARDNLFDPLAFQVIDGGGSANVRKSRPRAMEHLYHLIDEATNALEAERKSWTEEARPSRRQRLSPTELPPADSAPAEVEPTGPATGT